MISADPVVVPAEIRSPIRKMSAPRPAVAAIYYARTYALIGVAVCAHLHFRHPIATALAIAFIGARQTSLYVLNHDASHGALFKGRRLNKTVATVLSNLVFFNHPEAYSYVQWRRVHMLHHRFLFTEKDPNYVERRLAGDTMAAPTTGILLFQMAKAALLSPLHFFVAKQDYVSADGHHFTKHRFRNMQTLVHRFRDDPEMERERWLRLGFMTAALAAVFAADVWRPFLLLWILPMYTVYPALLRLMDLTEHAWSSNTRDVAINTRSIRPGLLQRIFVMDLHRNLHREHHLYPGVPLYSLPALSRLLCAAGIVSKPLRGFFARG